MIQSGLVSETALIHDSLTVCFHLIRRSIAVFRIQELMQLDGILFQRNRKCDIQTTHRIFYPLSIQMIKRETGLIFDVI